MPGGIDRAGRDADVELEREALVLRAAVLHPDRPTQHLEVLGNASVLAARDLLAGRQDHHVAEGRLTRLARLLGCGRDDARDRHEFLVEEDQRRLVVVDETVEGVGLLLFGLGLGLLTALLRHVPRKRDLATRAATGASDRRLVVAAVLRLLALVLRLLALTLRLAVGAPRHQVGARRERRVRDRHRGREHAQRDRQVLRERLESAHVRLAELLRRHPQQPLVAVDHGVVRLRAAPLADDPALEAERALRLEAVAAHVDREFGEQGRGATATDRRVGGRAEAERAERLALGRRAPRAEPRRHLRVRERPADDDAFARIEVGVRDDLRLRAADADLHLERCETRQLDVRARRPLPHVAAQVEHAVHGRGLCDRADFRRPGAPIRFTRDREARVPVVTPGVALPLGVARRCLELELRRQPQARPVAIREGIRVLEVDDRVRRDVGRHRPVHVAPVELPPVPGDERRRVLLLAVLLDVGAFRLVDRRLTPVLRRAMTGRVDEAQVLLVRGLEDCDVEGLDGLGLAAELTRQVRRDVGVALDELLDLLRVAADLDGLARDRDHPRRRSVAVRLGEGEDEEGQTGGDHRGRATREVRSRWSVGRGGGADGRGARRASEATGGREACNGSAGRAW